MVDEAQFQFYKASAVGASFALAAFLQWLLPVSGERRGIIRNWRVNLPIAALNVVIMAVICGGCMCAVANYASTEGFGLMNVTGMSPIAAVVLSVIALDLTAWVWHMANHRIPFLWRFHAVHHSDEVYDTSTAVRFHIGEIVISLVVRSAVVMALGIPVIGILAFEMAYAFFNFFEHGSIKLPERMSRALSVIFITPALHRIHHSTRRSHLDSNFGTIFSLWDRLGRTMVPDVPVSDYEVGLPTPAPWSVSLAGVLRHPFSRPD